MKEMSDKISLTDVILNQDPEMDECKRFNRMTNIAECWLEFHVNEFIERKQKDGVLFCIIEEFKTRHLFEKLLGIKCINENFVAECMEWYGFKLIRTFENESIDYYWVMEKNKFDKITIRMRKNTVEVIYFMDK